MIKLITKITAILLLSGINLYMVGQNTTSQVVSSASNTFENSYAQTSFTIGEVFVGVRQNEEAPVSVCLFEGFQSPTVIFPSAQRLFVSVFLEGVYNSGASMDTYLSTSGLIPLEQPYDQDPYFYSGTETIFESSPEMVDWILIEARTGVPNIAGSKGTTTVETRAGILMSDGTVIGEDLVEGVPFYNLQDNMPHFFCLRHRNHLDVLTATPILSSSMMNIDLSTSIEQAFGIEQLKLSSDNVPMLHSGDYNQDGIIQTTDYDLWRLDPAVNQIYEPADGNLDGLIQSTDYDTWFFNKAKVGSIEISY